LTPCGGPYTVRPLFRHRVATRRRSRTAVPEEP
jgi:hypothetical protein